MRKVASAKFTATAFDLRHISCLHGEELRGHYIYRQSKLSDQAKS